MEVIELGKVAASMPGRLVPDLAPLIESLGTSTFPGRLFALSHALTRTSHLTAFAYGRPNASPAVLMAENEGASRDSHHIADLYTHRFWQQDLANDVCSPAKPGMGRLVRTVAGEIGDGDYKQTCYTSARLSARACVSIRHGGACTRLNYYSPSGRDFSGSAIENIVRWSELFIMLLLKHHSIIGSSQEGEADYDWALRRLPVSLPSRERQVCVGILQGLSSEAIALRLDVSINTVRTFRKRAYARLEISSQNELMRLVTRALRSTSII